MMGLMANKKMFLCYYQTHVVTFPCFFIRFKIVFVKEKCLQMINLLNDVSNLLLDFYFLYPNFRYEGTTHYYSPALKKWGLYWIHPVLP